MPVELVCTACAARLRVPGFTPGRAVRCPKCATVFVPANPPQPAEPSEPPLAELVPEPPAPPPPPPAPAPNPFDFDKKPEPHRTGAAPKNAKIVGAPNPNAPPRARPVAPARQPHPEDEDGAPAPRATSGDKPQSAKARAREPEARPINPAVLIGGLALLALGAALIAGVLIFGRDGDDRAKRPPVAKEKEDPRPKPPEPMPDPEPPEPEPKPPEPKPVEKFKPPLFPVLNPPAPADPEPEPEPVRAPVAPAEPKEEPKGPVARAAHSPAPIFPTRAEDKSVLGLPAPASSVCWGGGGRFAVVRMVSARKIAVVDLCTGKLAGEIRMPEAGSRVAAGNEYVFVYRPITNEIERWSLVTFEREAVAKNPFAGNVEKLLVGHATDGPVFFAGPNRALDGRTLKEVTVVPEDRRKVFAPDLKGRANEFSRVHMSANGRVLAWYQPRSAPNFLLTVAFGDTAAGTTGHKIDESAGALVPGADGTVFTAAVRYTPELKPIGSRVAHEPWHHAPVPAAHGPFYMYIPPNATDDRAAAPDGPVGLYFVGRDRPLLDLSELTGLDLPVENNQDIPENLPFYERAFLVPEAGVLAVLSADGKQFAFHRVDALGALKKSGAKYLYVANRPPAAVAGEHYAFKPDVRTSGRPLRTELLSGPPGLSVAPDGAVTWVPPARAGSVVEVKLSIVDSTFAELIETFQIAVTSARPAAWPAPK